LATWLPEEPGAPRTPVQVVLNGAGVQDALYSAGRQGIVICPYSLVIKQPALFAKHNFEMVVADESHCLKDSKAQRTKAAAPLLAAARRAVCLTGTPALSRPIELFSQLQALQPRLFRSVNDYAQRFCQGGRFGWAQGCSHGDELHAVLGTTVLVRRLKRDVLDQLPPKIRTRILLPLQPSADVKRLTVRIGELRATGGDKHLVDQLTNELYTKTAEMKASACADYMETLLEGSPADSKFLFFAHHSVVLDTLGTRMKVGRVRHISIVGATPVGDRAGLVNQFQNDPAVRVALLSIKAAGVGRTLTAASTVVFGELTWTPGDIVQAEDRAHRIGQRGSVAVHILQAPGTSACAGTPLNRLTHTAHG
jgi:SWI/SNF-related matrix-associated actin-dependent regulator 1 of chromatin subfamily A